MGFGIQPGSLAEKLGIDKPESWFMEKMEECYAMFKANPSEFANLVLDAASQQNVLPILLMSPPEINKGLNFMLKSFFALGYMKGICKTETDQKWLKDWESKMKGE